MDGSSPQSAVPRPAASASSKNKILFEMKMIGLEMKIIGLEMKIIGME